MRSMMFALALFAATPALATPSGYQGWSLDYATPQIWVTVDNVSGSSMAGEREFSVTSDAPVVEIDGFYSCHTGIGDENRAYSAQAAFGSPYFAADVWNPYGANYAETTLFGGFGESPLRIYEGDDHAVYPFFEWEMELPDPSSSWSPERLVENRLQSYVDNGGSAEDFLRQDWFLEDTWPLHLLTKCEATIDGSAFYLEASGSQDVTVHVRYNADPDILAPILVKPVSRPPTIR